MPDPLLSGLSIAETSSPITTYHQLGGARTVCNTVLAVPSHLNGSAPLPEDAPWHSLEYVMIPPLPGSDGEAASVGEHVQATDELYYIHRGRGRLLTNGEPSVVSAGTLVIAPRGTRHSIANAWPGEWLTFLVIELHAPPGSASSPPMVIESLPVAQAHGLHALLGTHPLSLRIWQLNLASFFSAPWGVLSLIELPPGARLVEYCLQGQDENLFVVSGFATLFVGDVRIDSPETGGARNVMVPWGVPRRIVNASSRDPLTVLSVRVHRQITGLLGSQTDEAESTAARQW